MTTNVKSVPLGLLPKIFEKHNVDRAKLNIVIGYLISHARSEDQLVQYVDVGRSLDILGMDMLPRTMLQLEAGDSLIELITFISNAIKEGNLTSWVVKDHVLLLEMN